MIENMPSARPSRRRGQSRILARSLSLKTGAVAAKLLTRDEAWRIAVNRSYPQPSTQSTARYRGLTFDKLRKLQTFSFLGLCDGRFDNRAPLASVVCMASSLHLQRPKRTFAADMAPIRRTEVD
jgi:hypothetical protein